jgi:hypothetical protein
VQVLWRACTHASPWPRPYHLAGRGTLKIDVDTGSRRDVPTSTPPRCRAPPSAGNTNARWESAAVASRRRSKPSRRTYARVSLRKNGVPYQRQRRAHRILGCVHDNRNGARTWLDPTPHRRGRSLVLADAVLHALTLQERSGWKQVGDPVARVRRSGRSFPACPRTSLPHEERACFVKLVVFAAAPSSVQVDLCVVCGTVPHNQAWVQRDLGVTPRRITTRFPL